MQKKHLILVPSHLEYQALLQGFGPVLSISKGPYPLSLGDRREQKYLFVCCGIGSACAAAATAYSIASFAVGHITIIGLGGYCGSGYQPAEAYMGLSETFLRLGSISDSGQYDPLRSRMELLPPLKTSSLSFSFNLHPLPWIELQTAHFGTCDQISESSTDLKHLQSSFPDVLVENMEGAAVALTASLHDTTCSSIRVVCNQVGNRNLATWDLDKAKARLSEIGSRL